MLDFLRLAATYSIEIAQHGDHHHARPGWIQTHCPFCAGGISGFHLGYRIDTGHFNCWRCGRKSSFDVISGLLKTDNIHEIRKIYAQHAIDQIHIPKQLARARPKTCKPPRGIGLLKVQHKKYLRKRNFDIAELCDEWELVGTMHLSREWSWRIVSPIRDVDGFIVAWIGRSISSKAKAKYLITDNDKCAADPKSFLYGIDKATDGVVVVEGPADVWRLGPGAVALLGIDWTIQQASILRRFDRRFIMLDPDKTAQGQAAKLAEYISQFPGHTEIITGLDSDPGDLSPDEARDLMENLLPMGKGDYRG